MTGYNYCALLKFGKLEHLLSLRNEGNLHCKTLKYFAELEDECHRGDPLEAVTYFYNFDGGNVHLKAIDAPDEEYQLLGVADTGTLYHSYESSPGNLFCMYSFRIGQDELNKEFTIPEECTKMGDHYLVIKNYEEFLRRVSKSLSELNLEARHGFVGYKDFSKFTGSKTVFEKDIEFAFQKEFRIFIQTNIQQAIDIKIGSIADISEICRLDKEHAIRFFDIND